MNRTIILLSLIPAILWILFFYYQDKYEKEPFKMILFTFGGGCLSVIPAIIIELVLQGQIDYNIPFSPYRILITMLMVGLTEELCKYMAVKKIAYNSSEFNEPMDGIVYSVTAAMGFAFVENIGYMIRANMATGLVSAYTLGLMRALFSMFGHASFAVIMGSYLGRAKFDKAHEGSLIVKGLVLASLVHALYNFTLSIHKGIGAMGFVALIAFVVVWRNMNRVQVDTAVASSPFKPMTESYQPKKWKWTAANLLSLVLLTGVLILSLLTFDNPATFKNHKMEYLFQHPNYWNSSANEDFSVVELWGPSYRGHAPRVRIFTKKALNIKNIEKEMDNMLDELKAQMPGMEKISSEETTLGGLQAQSAHLSWTSTGKRGKGEIPMRSQVLVVIRGENRISILFDSNEENFEHFKEKFDKTAKSFIFGPTLSK